LEKIEDFEALKADNMTGINVTIPYKEQVIPYLDELSPAAQKIGAVNVIHFQQGKLLGYNSDAYGFEQSVTQMWRDKQPQKALVLGTGGAAKAVWYVLNKLGIEYLKVSRSKGDVTYSNLTDDIMKTHHLIINTTPLGMSPNIDACPTLPYDQLTDKHMLYDLVYNPELTLFLRKGKEHGATVKNGYDMLELQADRSWEIWNN